MVQRPVSSSTVQVPSKSQWTGREPGMSSHVQTRAERGERGKENIYQVEMNGLRNNKHVGVGD